MSSTLKNAPSQTIHELVSLPAVKDAFHFFATHADVITEDQIRICEIPASPFHEQQRAEYLCDQFSGFGLTQTTIDAEGNCLGLIKGNSLSPLLVVSAHLDTVFPVGTDFSVRRVENRWMGPGISDDGCGLAALIALARVFQAAGLQTDGSILFAATVGEEGEGNLRGVRHLFTKGEWANKVDMFVSFDGPGLDRITNRALGSRRYRIRTTGPGGHSWGDFGVPNPVHALGRAVTRLVSYPVPVEPRTTFNIGRIEGGTSINAIPVDARMDVDLRSANDAELRRLDAYFRRAVMEAVDDENLRRRPGDPALVLDMQLLGERPTGETPASSTIVELAQEATRSIGVEARLDQSSTDSNLPMSLGIPAITLGAGGQSGCSHTLDEWYDPTERDKGLNRALLVTLGLVGLRTSPSK